MAVLLLLNNFLHDFAAASWLVCGVILWRILNRPDTGPSQRPTIRTLLALMHTGLAGIIGCGAIRAVAYRSFEWNPEAGQAQVTLLITKHVVLTVAFAWALVYYIRAKRFLRHQIDDAPR